MSARRIGAVALALVAIGAAPAEGSRAVTAAPPHVARAFTVRAEATPSESAPGTRETELKVREAATRAVARNPPVGAFARAAAADLGLAEAYVGQTGPSADADTATSGDSDDLEVNEGGSHLEVHVDPSPRATAEAAGSAARDTSGRSGSVASTSTANGSRALLKATAQAEFHDLRIGPFLLGSGRFEGLAQTTGKPGGGHAEGFIRMSDASYEGIPITVGADGVQVDEQRLPDPLVRAATARIQEAFSPGGFADIRVVQPRVEVSADGTLARVSGGSVRLFFTNNDPAERYFFSYTLLAGTAETILGGVLSQPTPDRPRASAPLPAGAPPPPTARPPRPRAPEAPPEVADEPLPAEPELAFQRGDTRVSLAEQWRGWVIAVALVLAAWAVAGLLRRPALAPAKARLDGLLDEIADRYLRG